MREKFESKSLSIEGVLIDIQVYDILGYCSSAWIGNYAMIRTGPIHAPNQKDELVFLQEAIQKEMIKRKGVNSQPLRFSVCQLSVPSEDWTLICYQHYLLSHLISLPHIVLPIEPLFSLHPAEKDLLFIKADNQLCRQLNTEGWLYYCDWLLQGLNLILRKILNDDLAQYQFEAAIHDFSHEMTNILLLGYREEAKKLIQLPGERKNNEGFYEQLEQEKRLLKMHFEINADLQRVHSVLGDMAAKISKIEHLHPELIQTKNSILLLHALLGVQTDLSGTPQISQGQQMLILALLNFRLGVHTILNGDSPFNRTNIAFAIQLAAIQLVQSHGESAAIDLALHWDEIVNLVNREIKSKGKKGFERWIADPSTLLCQRASYVHKLRLFVWENLRLLSVPSSFEGEQNVNLDYLNFLPAYHPHK